MIYVRSYIITLLFDTLAVLIENRVAVFHRWFTELLFITNG